MTDQRDVGRAGHKMMATLSRRNTGIHIFDMVIEYVKGRVDISRANEFVRVRR